MKKAARDTIEPEVRGKMVDNIAKVLTKLLIKQILRTSINY